MRVAAEATRSEISARQGAHVIEMQRRRLLSAFVEVLRDGGYEVATVGRICKLAGVSRRTFYDLYVDREACFLDALEVAIRRIASLVIPAYTGDGLCWRERVREALKALLECFDTEPGLARLCVVETLKGGPLVLARRRALNVALMSVIDEGRNEAKSLDPPPLTAESLVGGAVAVIHSRLVERDRRPFILLLNPLTSMIVLSYLGPTASRRERDRPVVVRKTSKANNANGLEATSNPFKGLPIRITFRTARVLSTIGSQPEASNRDVAQAAGITDQGQMSKLLRRLERAGLIENHGQGQAKGEANAWQLTPQGRGVLHAVGEDA